MLAVAIALGGCFHSNSSVCSDGTICPPGTQCVYAPTTSCVSQDQIDACTGIADGMPCTVTSMGTGICRGGWCSFECGNGVISAGEACDDGNENPADGCDHCVATTWTATAAAGDVLATSVGFTNPAGIAVDEAGNIFVADTDLHRIRRIHS